MFKLNIQYIANDLNDETSLLIKLFIKLYLYLLLPYAIRMCCLESKHFYFLFRRYYLSSVDLGKRERGKTEYLENT